MVGEPKLIKEFAEQCASDKPAKVRVGADDALKGDSEVDQGPVS